MNKTMKHVLTFALALVMCLALAAPAMAFTYTAIPGGSTSFQKYLVLESTANVPDVTFSFTIEPGDAVPAEGVLPGPTGSNAPTVSSAVFSNADNGSKSTTAPTNESVQLNGQAYVAKTVNVDLAGVSFPEPGIYRYKITENSGNVPGVTYNTTPIYLDVYVVDNTSGDQAPALSISGYVFHSSTTTSEVTQPDNRLSDKVTGIQNSYATYDLKVSKTVTGNKGSRDKYFAITVTIFGNAGDTHQVEYTNGADTTISANPNSATTCIPESGATNPATLTIAAEASSLTQVFYIQHGQTFTIKDLPAGTKYTVTEAPEDYIPSYGVTTTGTETGTVVPAGTSGSSYTSATGGLTADTTVAFTNHRAGVIATGVLLTVAPFVVLMLVGLAGAMVILKKKHS